MKTQSVNANYVQDVKKEGYTERKEARGGRGGGGIRYLEKGLRKRREVFFGAAAVKFSVFLIKLL